jgi:superfamily II DNA/RNA helicase
VRESYSPEEVLGESTESLLPNVRLVNGSTKPETRQRLMLAFNTPFYPEILIASSVLAEGVDLHLNCRHVLHHDLCWNPSTLEQRTGRVDRIGAKAERCGQPILVFLPYIAETQDEKMYRVVMDRERWFQVVMGEEYRLDLASTERWLSGCRSRNRPRANSRCVSNWRKPIPHARAFSAILLLYSASYA